MPVILELLRQRTGASLSASIFIFWPFATGRDSCLLHSVLGTRLPVLGPTSAPSQYTPTFIFSPNACLFSVDGCTLPSPSVRNLPSSCSTWSALSSPDSGALISTAGGASSPRLLSLGGARGLSVGYCVCVCSFEYSHSCVPQHSCREAPSGPLFCHLGP